MTVEMFTVKSIETTNFLRYINIYKHFTIGMLYIHSCSFSLYLCCKLISSSIQRIYICYNYISDMYGNSTLDGNIHCRSCIKHLCGKEEMRV